MAQADIIIEESLESGMVELLEDLTYISANSVPVSTWRDVDDQQYKTMVMVHANPAKPAIKDVPNAGAFSSSVDIIIRTFSKIDTDRSVLNDIYQEVLGLAHSLQLDPSDLTTASEITIDGIRMISSGGDDINADGFQVLVVKMDAYTQV